MSNSTSNLKKLRLTEERMKTSYTTLINAMSSKDWQTANERFADIMEQKVAARLAEEKRGLQGGGPDPRFDGSKLKCLDCGKKFKNEDAKDNNICPKCGSDSVDMSESATRAKTSVKEDYDYGESSDYPGYVEFSVNTGDGYSPKSYFINQLKYAGVTDVKTTHSPYVGQTLFLVPKKFAKKADRILLG